MNKTILQKQLTFPQSDQILVDIYKIAQQQHVIIVLPALGVAIQKYEPLIQHLIEQGFNVIAADYPGCGRNTPSVSATFDFGYADLLGYFIPQLVNIALELSPQIPILLGHSLGGHLATLYAQHHVIKVIGIATGNIGLKYWDYKGKFNILKAAVIFNAMILKDGYLEGYKVGFGNKEAKTLMHDWSKVIFTGNYRHILPKESLSKNPALFIQFKQDDFAPMSSTLGLSRYFYTPKVQQLDLTQSLKGHQHSVWLKQPKAVVELIRSFIRD
ncbi:MULTISPECIES: alpha/beta fold hydrolase [unclassified Acinetobacter]|uniref:alpha/beta fold hydrolase n=1 Tax=unclassified Acinetobacter TaxID=196816 RepID=UPI0025779F5D|nr:MULTISPECIES: alpha/beta fold hydrolase [unclassified Acinetobacter]MDM1757116.1 alpha/beta fold hydrolase [Acinetobacter sp. 256-1]MDM1760101.1 alpha/beta fold hydrolase [Acinetobacter sp. 251-1]